MLGLLFPLAAARMRPAMISLEAYMGTFGTHGRVHEKENTIFPLCGPDRRNTAYSGLDRLLHMTARDHFLLLF